MTGVLERGIEVSFMTSNSLSSVFRIVDLFVRDSIIRDDLFILNTIACEMTVVPPDETG